MSVNNFLGLFSLLICYIINICVIQVIVTDRLLEKSPRKTNDYVAFLMFLFSPIMLPLMVLLFVVKEIGRCVKGKIYEEEIWRIEEEENEKRMLSVKRAGTKSKV